MKRVLVNSLVLVAWGILAAPAAAQYKWLTPEGTTVYSDVPPPSGARLMNDWSNDPVQKPVAATAAASTANPDLPYELKAVAGKFPVMLYTAPDCAPCSAARQHLSARGVPFGERTITTTADFEAFKTRGFSDNSFPALTVGREKTIGFEAGAYDRLLTAAGYPRSSQLPANYRQAAAEPMIAPQPQKMTVTVQQAQPTGAAGAAAGEPSAIERYRQQIQAGTANRQDDEPSMRF
jgi:glutaredoxin